MKRVLLLTYHVPPRAGIACIRVGQMIQHLRAFGWDVVPVTPDLGDVQYEPRVVTTGVVDFKAPMRRLLGVRGGETTSAKLGVERGAIDDASKSLKQRAISFGHDITEYANRSFGWLRPGTAAVAKILHDERINAVISTSPPETTHYVASRVHGSIPWIADLRDPWVREGMRARRAPLNAIDRMMEPRILRSASAITTVSDPLAAQLRDRYPDIPVHSVPNAFSSDDWDEIPFEEPAKATFLYAGQLYGGRADPRPFFQAVSQLLRDELVRPDELQIDFYGDSSEWLTNEVRRAGIASVVRVHGVRARSEILRLERKSSRLLLFLWNDKNERGTYTGKFFEYLGARRPILALGGPEETVIDDALRQTRAGSRLRTVAGIRDAVLQAVVEWRNRSTPIIDVDSVAPFESRYLGRRFADILDEATARTLVRR